MSAETDLHDWLSGKVPTTSAQASTPAPVSPAPLDYVAEFIAKRNAAAAARPSPLVPQRPVAEPEPTPTGDLVKDFGDRMNRWRASRPNPLRQR